MRRMLVSYWRGERLQGTRGQRLLSRILDHNGEAVVETPEKSAERPPLAQARSDVPARYDRLNALFFAAREARRSGRILPDTERLEALALLQWVEEVTTVVFGDREVFRSQVGRDEAAFALALRLKDDALVVRQLVQAAEDLMAVL